MNIKCPVCVDGLLEKVTQQAIETEDGVVLSYDRIYSECTHCGIQLVDGPQMELNRRYRKRALAAWEASK